jgi:hypothetical protein
MKRQEIEQLLPQVFQRTAQPDSPLGVLLDVMEHLHHKAEQRLAGLADIFNPRRTEDGFVPMLSGWVDLERVLEPSRKGSAEEQSKRALSTGLGCLRELTATAAALSKFRGTALGLIKFLQTATGTDNFRIIENQTADGQPKLYHVVVYASASLRNHTALLKRIIESEKPAHVTYELVLETEKLDTHEQ